MVNLANELQLRYLLYKYLELKILELSRRISECLWGIPKIKSEPVRKTYSSRQNTILLYI